MAFMEAVGVPASPDGIVAVELEAFGSLLQRMTRAESYGQRAFSANTPAAGVQAPKAPKGEELEEIQVGQAVRLACYVF